LDLNDVSFVEIVRLNVILFVSPDPLHLARK
jgi:hypothetical protein